MPAPDTGRGWEPERGKLGAPAPPGDPLHGDTEEAAVGASSSPPC